jgi:hypothetical protein
MASATATSRHSRRRRESAGRTIGAFALATFAVETSKKPVPKAALFLIWGSTRGPRVSDFAPRIVDDQEETRAERVVLC